MEQVKVKCLVCDRNYFADSSDVPTEAEVSEAFKCECPYCSDGHYAEVVD